MPDLVIRGRSGRCVAGALGLWCLIVVRPGPAAALDATVHERPAVPAYAATLLTWPAEPGGVTAQSATSATQTTSAKKPRARRTRTSVQQPRFKRDANGALVPDVRAEAAIIFNPSTKEVLYESNSHDRRSIASLTKMMTAIVFLEYDADVDRTVVVERADVRAASTTFLKAREAVQVDTLLHLALVASDNGAARALARVSPLGTDRFVAVMNRKAAELGLTSTRYADPSGLDAENVSSAYDMARLISYASANPRIADIMRLRTYRARVGRRTFTVKSTNRLLETDIDVRGGKTGFIRKAGYCLAALLQLPQGAQVAVVVLGARTNMARFSETRHLLSWISERLHLPAVTDPDPQPQP